jgi:hypothetical protein
MGDQSFLPNMEDQMNTANLQLEGLLVAIAGINRALVAKGLIKNEEIEHALSIAEQTVLGDDRLTEDMSPSNRDAVAFPIRVLRIANRLGEAEIMKSFAELARDVGKTKGPHNDQV